MENKLDIKKMMEAFHDYSENSDDLVLYYKALNQLVFLAGGYLLIGLQSKNIFDNRGGVYELDEVVHRLNFKLSHTRFLELLLELLASQGYINEIDKGIYELNESSQVKAENLDKKLSQLINENPDIKHNAQFLKQVIESYYDIFSKTKNFLSIIFPLGSLEYIEKLYKLGLDTAYFNKLVAHVVHCYALQSESFSIIEIGAGVGSTTDHVLPTLNELECDYSYNYTDISKTFTRYGRQRYADMPNAINFTILDISKSPELQGYQEKFDMVIATNVLHATNDIEKTLSNVKMLMKPEGILIINEGVEKSDFSTLAYGLLDGWWLSEDSYRIPGCPAINLATWKKLLIQVGFNEIISMNELLNNNNLYQDVIVATL